MKRMRMIMWLAVGILVLAVPAFPEATVNQGQGQAIVTILPRSNSQALGAISQKDLTVEISGHKPRITGWVPLRGSESDLEMVLLIDSSARTSLGTQLGDITNFIRTLPNQVKVAVGYMNAGRAILSGPLSTDHASARREVVMITDGIDNYYPRFDMLDPYVNAAIQDAVRARLVVYSIYWRGQGRAQGSISRGFDGQRQLERVSQATGGISYWQGAGVPVSFGPYFQNIALRIQNQYRLSFSSQSNGKPEVRRLSVKVIGPEVNVYAPQRVFIDNSREE
jgi:hypothetical protein